MKNKFLKITFCVVIFAALVFLGQNCSKINVAKVEKLSTTCIEPDSYQISVSQEPNSADIRIDMTQTIAGEVSLVSVPNTQWQMENEQISGANATYTFPTPAACSSSLKISAQFQSMCGKAVQTETEYIDSRCEEPPEGPQQCPAPAAGITLQNGTAVYPNNVSIAWNVPTVNFGDIFGISMAGTLSQDPNYISPNVFPGYGGGRVFLIQKNQYLALKFTVPTDTEFTSGYWRTDGPATIIGVPRSKVSMTISKCPGVFDSTQVGAGCAYDSAPSLETQLVYWSTSVIANLCHLEKGQTYYFNMINAPLTNPTQSFCTNSVCMNQITTHNTR